MRRLMIIVVVLSLAALHLVRHAYACTCAPLPFEVDTLWRGPQTTITALEALQAPTPTIPPPTAPPEPPSTASPYVVFAAAVLVIGSGVGIMVGRRKEPL